MQFQSATLQQNDAILLALFLVGLAIRLITLFKNVGEELAHTLLVAAVFEIHISHETLGLSVSVGTLEQHAQVMQTADVIFADIDYEARLCLLLDSDLATLLLRPNLDTWLSNLDFLLIEVRGDLDSSVAVRDTCDGVCYSLLDVLVEVINFLA